MKRIWILIWLLFVVTGITSQSTTVDLEHLDNYYQQVINDWKVPGMTIGIVKDGELIFAKGYGTKEVGKNSIPDPKTLYAIASNSKAFTSAIIAMLVEEGKLSWNQKVQEILPYFQLYDPAVSAMTTVKDLLCHRVGLGTFSGDAIWYKSTLSGAALIKKFKHVPQAYDFRAGYGYSNLMYITAGEVIEQVTGKSWAQNVKEKILEPLGMNRTIASIKELDMVGNYSTPHEHKDGQNNPIEWANWDNVVATGGLISSIHDMAKWMIWNLNHGIMGQDTMISTTSRNLMWSPHNSYVMDHTSKNDFNRHFSGYGLGWGLSDHHGRLRVSHGGGYDGMISAVNLIPDENLGIVVLTNGMKSPTMAVTYYTIDKFLGIEGKDWSKVMLESRNNRIDNDTRISSRIEKRKPGTTPSLTIDKMTGIYHAPIYGNVLITDDSGRLKISFEHSPELDAYLEHWHYDVWKLNWVKDHAWFSFGTVKFETDNNREVTRLTFDVPNDDIFFEEIVPVKTK